MKNLVERSIRFFVINVDKCSSDLRHSLQYQGKDKQPPLTLKIRRQWILKKTMNNIAGDGKESNPPQFLNSSRGRRHNWKNKLKCFEEGDIF